MAGMGPLFCFSLLLAIIGANASGKLTILDAPKSISFHGNSAIHESHLAEVLSAAAGMSVAQSVHWDGLYIDNPFYTPEAIVEIYLDGINDLALGGEAAEPGQYPKSYPVIVDEFENDDLNILRERIVGTFSKGDNKFYGVELRNKNSVIEAGLAYPAVSDEDLKPFGSLNPKIEEDRDFLLEIEVLKSVVEQLTSIDPGSQAIDLYFLRFKSLHILKDFYGVQSQQMKDATQLLKVALQTVSASFETQYKGKALVAVLQCDVAHTRRTVRAARQNTAGNDPAGKYSADYPVIFNIIMWFAVVLVFTLVAIVYAIMDMDPGRDSIIYRMTSTKIKKDN